MQTNKYRPLASADRDEVATYILCGLTEWIPNTVHLYNAVSIVVDKKHKNGFFGSIWFDGAKKYRKLIATDSGFTFSSN